MKTSNSIAEQDERKAARSDGETSPVSTPPVREKLKQRDATRIAAWKWKPGQSGNPTGKGRNDLAAEIARAVFENNAEALYRAFSKTAMKGTPMRSRNWLIAPTGSSKNPASSSTRPIKM